MPRPLPPIHREHATLAGMTDEQAAREASRLLRATRKRRLAEAAAFGLCVGIIGALVGAGLVVVLSLALGRVAAWWIIPFGFVLFLVVGYIGGVWQYAVLSSAALHASLRADGRHVRLCFGCGYPLDGLPVHSERVQCPECGAENLSRLVAQADAPQPLPPLPPTAGANR